MANRPVRELGWHAQTPPLAAIPARRHRQRAALGLTGLRRHQTEIVPRSSGELEGVGAGEFDLPLDAYVPHCDAGEQLLALGVEVVVARGFGRGHALLAGRSLQADQRGGCAAGTHRSRSSDPGLSALVERRRGRRGSGDSGILASLLAGCGRWSDRRCSGRPLGARRTGCGPKPA